VFESSVLRRAAETERELKLEQGIYIISNFTNTTQHQIISAHQIKEFETGMEGECEIRT
jgi:hypothetical protein